LKYFGCALLFVCRCCACRNLTGNYWQKYKEETENYQIFLKICEEVVETNEKICNAEPACAIEDGSELAELKKKLQRHFMKRLQKKLRR